MNSNTTQKKRTRVSLLLMLGAAVALGTLQACSSSQEAESIGTASYEESRELETSYISTSKISDLEQQLAAYRRANFVEANSEEAKEVFGRIAIAATRYEEALIASLDEDNHIQRRRVAAAVLGFAPEAKHADLLLDLAMKQSALNEEQVIAAWAAFGVAATAQSIHDLSDHERRSKLVDRIAQLTLPLDALPATRMNAVIAYATAYSEVRGDPLDPLIWAAENDAEMSVREVAIAELGRLGNEVAVPVMCRALVGQSEPSIRRAAAIGLGNTPGTRSFDQLTTALESEKDEGVMSSILVAIGKQSGVADPKDLVIAVDSYISNTSPKVRAATAKALGIVKDPSAIYSLVLASFDGDRKVRLASVSALRSIAPKGAAQEKQTMPIIERLEDTHAEIINETYRLLTEMTGENYGRDKELWKTEYFFEKYPEIGPDGYKGMLRVRPPRSRNQNSGNSSQPGNNNTPRQPGESSNRRERRPRRTSDNQPSNGNSPG